MMMMGNQKPIATAIVVTGRENDSMMWNREKDSEPERASEKCEQDAKTRFVRTNQTRWNGTLNAGAYNCNNDARENKAFRPSLNTITWWLI